MPQSQNAAPGRLLESTQPSLQTHCEPHCCFFLQHLKISGFEEQILRFCLAIQTGKVPTFRCVRCGTQQEQLLWPHEPFLGLSNQNFSPSALSPSSPDPDD